MEEKKTK